MYTENSSLPFYPPPPFSPRCQRANSILGELHCLKESHLKLTGIFAKSRRGETVSNRNRAKIMGAKLTLYKVYKE